MLFHPDISILYRANSRIGWLWLRITVKLDTLRLSIQHRKEKVCFLRIFSRKIKNSFLRFRKLKFFCLHKHIIDPLNNQFKCSLYSRLTTRSSPPKSIFVKIVFVKKGKLYLKFSFSLNFHFLDSFLSRKKYLVVLGTICNASIIFKIFKIN